MLPRLSDAGLDGGGNDGDPNLLGMWAYAWSGVTLDQPVLLCAWTAACAGTAGNAGHDSPSGGIDPGHRHSSSQTAYPSQPGHHLEPSGCPETRSNSNGSRRTSHPPLAWHLSVLLCLCVCVWCVCVRESARARGTRVCSRACEKRGGARPSLQNPSSHLLAIPAIAGRPVDGHSVSWS